MLSVQELKKEQLRQLLKEFSFLTIHELAQMLIDPNCLFDSSGEYFFVNFEQIKHALLKVGVDGQWKTKKHFFQLLVNGGGNLNFYNSTRRILVQGPDERIIYLQMKLKEAYNNLK